MQNLKRVLLLNAVTSAATGLLLVMFSAFISALFELDAVSIIASVGIFLLVYAAYVVYTALKVLGQTRIVIALDILWVVVSAGVLLVYGDQISLIGNVLIIGVALWVGLMAFLQNKFARGIV